MELFYAVSKSDPEFGIVSALAGNKFFMTHTNKNLWENATIEDWEYLDSTVEGELFKNFELVACPPKTELTNIKIPTKH